MADKQDSNLTGLSYAEESAVVKVLPGTPIWRALEPNSYSDFGGQIATVARSPIDPSRQRKKGTVTDLDASGGFNHDLTTSNLTHLLQGFFCANATRRTTTVGLNDADATVAVTAVSSVTDIYTLGAAIASGWAVGDLVLAQGFTNAANNGIKVVQTADTDTVIVGDGLVTETPPSTASLAVVGTQLGSGTSAIVMSGSLVRLTDSAYDFTDLNLEAGDWVYVGGDASTTRFASNQGYARVKTVPSNGAYIEFDKVSWGAEAETGTGKTIQLFVGWRLKNTQNVDFKTYQLERTLGEDDDGVQSEYLVGAVANELTVNVPTADKVTIDLSFVALDNEQRTGDTGVKDGTRVAAVTGDAINTTTNVRRINIAAVSTSDAQVTPLVAYCTDLTLTLNNNATALKAIGTLGGFDRNVGMFEVGGSLEAYFATVGAVAAIRNNADITLDIVIFEDNKGIVFDIPLLSLGDGRLNIEKDEAVKIPLESSAFQSEQGHTLLYMHFPYLPNAAGQAFVQL